MTHGVEYSTQLLSDGKRWNAALKWTFIASKEHDGRVLTCRSENAALKQPAKATIRVEVKYAPEVQLRISSTHLQIGDDVVFICDAKGNPNQLLYKWFKNEELIVGDHGTRLLIPNVNKDLNGAIISCEVSNSVGTTRAKHVLSITYGPTFKTPLDAVYGAELGEDVKLRCDVDGNPRPEVSWFLLGQNHVLNTGPDLMIHNINKEKTGKYMCRASVKGFPEISATSLVFIKGNFCLLKYRFCKIFVFLCPNWKN